MLPLAKNALSRLQETYDFQEERFGGHLALLAMI
ncbi:mCG13797, isoform CRA_a [Mus musculus]|nr:mCG13797, isoform CRA_a [Mus musculus]